MSAKAHPRVRVVHFREADAGPLLDGLRAARFEVEYQESFDAALFSRMKSDPPAAFVIDLSRAPSKGRYLGVALRASKKARGVPVLFTGADPKNEAALRAALADAIFTTPSDAPGAVRRAIENPPSAAAPAPDPMRLYADRGVAAKLGITAGLEVTVIDPPPRYEAMIGELPDGASLVEDRSPRKMTLWWIHDVDGFLAVLPAMRRAVARTKLWIVYPKQSARAASGLTQQSVREAAMEMGLVDYKICRIDATWTAMAFTVKKASG